ncbi:MAG: hypothetical protein ABIH23_11350, partial [bacterium]
VCLLGLVIASTAYGSPVVPMSEAGVTPITGNIILNPGDINGGSLESIGVVILPNGNVAAGWEDDGTSIPISAGWVMIDSAGNFIVSQPQAYANAAGAPTATNGGWGPKMHGNQWGDGFIFGSAFWDFAGIDHPDNWIEGLDFLVDDEPAMQLINNDGTFNGSLFLPYPLEFHEREGSIRVGDDGILSNGNIVVVGEDRQGGDGPELFGLPNADRVIIVGTCTPDGTPVAGPIAVQTADSRGEMWHGIATFEGGFGVRYANAGINVRFFDNNLNPTTGQILLPGTLNSGGRGDSAGFHANKKGDCVLVTGEPTCVVAVLDKLGNVKVGPIEVYEPDIEFGHGARRVDGAIDEAGNFMAVWRDKSLPGMEFADGTGVIAARFFNANGTPATPPFVVSDAIPVPFTEEWGLSAMEDNEPRVTMRDGVVAIVWQDENMNALGVQELVIRLLASPFGAPVSDWSIY